jgi:hypothetical protein
MLTLSYGFKKPQTNDKGPVVFPALEANWQQVNDHTHNGVNSAHIASGDITKTTQTILAAGWNDLGGGNYSQTKTLPGSLQYDDVSLSFKDNAGNIIYPSVVKASATNYTVFVNDNTLDLTVLIN